MRSMLKFIHFLIAGLFWSVVGCIVGTVIMIPILFVTNAANEIKNRHGGGERASIVYYIRLALLTGGGSVGLFMMIWTVFTLYMRDVIEPMQNIVAGIVGLVFGYTKIMDLRKESSSIDEDV